MQSALTSELHSISPYLATASADKMTFLILVIVLFIALIVFMVLSAKKTHWMNLVGVFFVFVFAVFYMMMIPNVLKTRSAWLENAQRNEQRYVKQQDELKQLLTGTSGDFQYPEGSLKRNESLARAQVFGRGRVWRKCIPGAFTAGADPANLATGSVVVELPPDSPSMKAQPLANVAGAEASENVSLVYVFLETVDPNNGSAKLSNYIGSFFATNPTDDNKITLTPSLILPDPDNIADVRASNPNYKTARELVETERAAGTYWAMYDILPTDSYDVFVEAWRAEKGDPKLDVTLQMLKDEVIPKYLPDDLMRMQNDKAKYDAVVNPIIYTGQPKKVYTASTKIEDDGIDDGKDILTVLEDNLWYEVEFKEKAKKSITVDFTPGDEAAQKQIALRGLAFDRQGLALVEVLKLGEAVVFDAGDKLLLDHDSWVKNPTGVIADMKDANTIEEKQIYYRRKLNDFDYEFRQLVATDAQLTSDRDHAKEKLEEGLQIEAMYEKQKKTREELVNKLNKDVTSFKADLAVVQDYRKRLEAKYQAEKAETDQLYRTIKELYAKKQLLAQEASRQAEERSRKAAESSGDTE